MPNRADYQPLAQSADEQDIENGLGTGQNGRLEAGSRRSRGLRRSSRPGPIDMSKLDAAFKRYGRLCMILMKIVLTS